MPPATARFALASSWRLFPDAPPALAALRGQGLRLGIVSNFDSRLHAICAGLGLADAVDFVLPSAEVGHAKPSPGIFEAAVRRAGTAPSRTLMVGDSPVDDVAGARAAGLRAILLCRDGENRGDECVHSLAELPPLIVHPA